MKICPPNGTSLFSVHLFQDCERLFQCIISIIVLRNDRNVCFQERVACLTFKRGKFTIQFDCSDWIHYSPVARVRPHFRCLFLPCCNFRLLFFFGGICWCLFATSFCLVRHALLQTMHSILMLPNTGQQRSDEI